MQPGVNSETLERATPSVIPTDVGQGHMVGVTESGPNIPKYHNRIRNIEEYENLYAPSGRSYLPGQIMYDSANEWFNQGGSALFIGRVTGAASAAASVDVVDASDGVVLEVTAKGDGEWGNDIQVRVDLTAQDADIPANHYRIYVIRDSNDQVLEVSPYIPNTDSAITWSKDSEFIDIAGGVSILLPDPAVYDLAGGANDVAGITNPQWVEGMASLGSNLGPGILMVPGATSDTLHQAAAAHAKLYERRAFLDGPDTNVIATLVASAKAVTDSEGRSRRCGIFAPWVIVPGPTSGSVVKVPPSASVGGVFSRNMSANMSANEPAAGDNGILRNVLDFTQVFTDTERTTLNNNGVNVLRDVYGTAKIYGWRTTADPVADAKWLPLSNSILHSQIMAMADAIGEEFVFKQIDGQKRLTGRYGAALSGRVCLPLFMQGALYGTSPTEAYNVDVGDNVNTPTTIANNELRAVISVKEATFGETVTVYVVKYLITETIPA